MMKDLWMHQAGADDEHLTSSRCSCRGDPYRFIAVFGSALPLNVHHRAGHVAESKSLHDISFAGCWAFGLMSDKAQAGAVGQDYQTDARSVRKHVDSRGPAERNHGHQIAVN